MKKSRTFRESWFLLAIAATVLVGELVAWEVATHFGLRNNPLVVAFFCVGLVAAITSVLYEGIDIG